MPLKMISVVEMKSVVIRVIGNIMVISPSMPIDIGSMIGLLFDHVWAQLTRITSW
ncbi:hypothetical protein VspSTUT16_13500 [Vibrio sp. STUT-A16]|nr:hypothetical protein VspSTUT16_13500 [Vibrio sp. STUT-A16]